MSSAKSSRRAVLGFVPTGTGIVAHGCWVNFLPENSLRQPVADAPDGVVRKIIVRAA